MTLNEDEYVKVDVLKETKKMLSLNATKIRMGIIEGTHSAKAGHPGGSLSSADLFAYLYFYVVIKKE